MTTSGEHPTDPSAIGETAATDIGGQRLAKVYAQAILDAADAAGCRNEVLAELHSLATDVQSKVPAARALFASPRVSIEEKELLVEKYKGEMLLGPPPKSQLERTLQNLLKAIDHLDEDDEEEDEDLEG